MIRFGSKLCFLSDSPDNIHLPHFYLHHREVFDMGGWGLPKVPRKALPLAWKYTEHLVPSDSMLQDCTPCVLATTGLSVQVTREKLKHWMSTLDHHHGLRLQAAKLDSLHWCCTICQCRHCLGRKELGRLLFFRGHREMSFGWQSPVFRAHCSS